MKANAKIWIEEDGKLVLSGYRVRLLQLIEEAGSLAEAAKVMGLSYRRAWGKVKELERNLGVPLLESAAGGSGGGGSQLTPEGRKLVARYERFRIAADTALAEAFRVAFPESRPD